MVEDAVDAAEREDFSYPAPRKDVAPVSAALEELGPTERA